MMGGGEIHWSKNRRLLQVPEVSAMTRWPSSVSLQRSPGPGEHRCPPGGSGPEQRCCRPGLWQPSTAPAPSCAPAPLAPRLSPHGCYEEEHTHAKQPQALVSVDDTISGLGKGRAFSSTSSSSSS
ncbi:hypothetical protein HJG60_008065 [Phyllostomus discolor]|uniref:Uncharacterized protein n=1 Tax=Phyllostomus discolor TaxID=89673 RepID=A0A834BNA1_9CHIR|nr:hypothetical protein HJG60_008065 [Phyllostomus discolor]